MLRIFFSKCVRYLQGLTRFLYMRCFLYSGVARNLQLLGLTRNSQLATRNSRGLLATRNSPLATL